MSLPLPSPTDFLPASEVAANNFVIEEVIINMFTPDINGDCGSNEATIAVANRSTCIYWQKIGTPVPYFELLLALRWLTAYIKYGSFVMNYDATVSPVKPFTGQDGITRNWTVETNTELCAGFGGAAFNGQSWCAVGQDSFRTLTNSVQARKPVMPQVLYYEMGRAMYNLRLDEILDWQMQQPGEFGFWTLGFNGAMTALGPRFMGCELDYFGQDAALFRANRLLDLSTYVDNPSYTFQNTWSVLLLPWNASQSINDLMSGFLIYLYENYGELLFLHEMYRTLLQQPDIYPRDQREQRASNLVRACYQTALAMFGEPRALEIYDYFFTTLRWTFLGAPPGIILSLPYSIGYRISSCGNQTNS
jgi:hypothetical protein